MGLTHQNRFPSPITAGILIIDKDVFSNENHWNREMTTIQQITETVQHVVGAISAAMGVDVAIIDTNFKLAATSKTFLEKRGENINQNFVKGVFEKDVMVLPNPGHNELCKGCHYEGSCPETAEVLRTIRYDGQLMGVILMVAYTQAQKEKLLNNTSELLEFLGEMANLLVSEIRLQRTLEQETVVKSHLETTINLIGNGIITVNGAGMITQINAKATQLLKSENQIHPGMKLQSFLPYASFQSMIENGEIISRREILTGSQPEIHCFMSGNPVKVNDSVVGAVIYLEDIKAVRSTVYEFSAKQMDHTFDDIHGESQVMKEVKHYSKKIASGDSTILISGESGTGKELFARAIHSYSARTAEPFISINCAAIPETLLESELFGYDEGAFSGARKGGKPGKFEMASGGSIFLDEIGDMPLHMQAKLLRVLQEKTIERVGGIKTITVDIRIIAATNQDLETMQKMGTFRKDLYYRLNVLPLHIPPLRNRGQDVIALADYFLEKSGGKLGKRINGFSGDAREAIASYYWPGNVRELENTIEYAVNMESGPLLEKESLPSRITMKSRIHTGKNSLAAKLRDYEQFIIKEALEIHGQTLEGKKRVARELCISLPTLYRKLN